MDVFDLDREVVAQYEQFSRSFTKIKSQEIQTKVDALYQGKQFWPEPLLQINPHYDSGGTVQQLIDGGQLEPECAQIFKNKWGVPGAKDATMQLRKHQEQSVSLAEAQQSFVVTTGTGSGKSLCFFVPIIDAALKAKKRGAPQKTRAIIIYPMNALANSQANELQGYLGSASEGPVTYARYTGQESSEERDLIRNNPPDILLTNFMMLELLMTRQEERDQKVLENCEGLEFIVLDELHTYRGRQGADVAMLMRRLRSRIGNPAKPPLCIGTSATMASEGSRADKNEAVALISSQIFGAQIGPDAVVTETLKRVTDTTKFGNAKLPGLAASVQKARAGQAAEGKTNEELASDPLAIWVETRIGLKDVETKPERAKPISLRDAARQLAADTALSHEECSEALRAALISFSVPEKDRNVPGSTEQAPLFAFKLHQFVAGAGRLYSTLLDEGSRDVTFSGQVFNPNNPDERLYSTHFCRSCGQEFHPVTLRRGHSGEYFEKREIDDLPVEGDENDDGADWGFLMPEPNDPEFTFSGKDDDYPDAWIEEKPNGEKRLKPTYRKRRAQQYSVGCDGAAHVGNRQAWFMPGKYRFCPSCGDVNTSSARDINKLASLSAESRSSATTILLSTILRWMNKPDSVIQQHSRKLLSFTDNRQDAALQAGHFNDFIFVTMLRGAIISALRSDASHTLDEANIGEKVQQALGFLADSKFTDRAAEWLANTGLKGQARIDAEQTLRQNLQHLFWIDQRRGWRYTNPNLEQLGLLTARYKYLDEIAADDEEFANSEILSSASVAERQEALKQLFDHMRKWLAVDCSALEKLKLEALAGENYNRIKSPWDLSEDRIIGATIFMTEPPKRKEMRNRDEERLVRGSPTSAIGKIIRDQLTFGGKKLKFTDVPEVIDGLLKASENYGAVVKETSPFGGDGWRLKANGVQFVLDETLASKELSNDFFVGVYKTIADMLDGGGQTLFGFEGREHTAQVEGDLRELREMRFRYEDEDQKALASKEEHLRSYREDSRFLPTLFCSPTMELGVDISAMNVVYLRNAPPTAANYAQRSGRAGRSGQAALILTYCAAMSPHDQYFFDRKTDLVEGVVVPPAIDLKNKDLVESHLNAEWLASMGKECDLAISIKDNLSLAEPNKPLLPELRDAAQSTSTTRRALGFIDGVLTALEADYGADKPRWYSSKQAVTDELIRQAPKRFNLAFDRWRDLLLSAENTVATASKMLEDYTISSSDRKAATARQQMGNFQRTLLLDSSRRDNDFYLYRYLATEGFLPGYNFPRLPLMAYVQSQSDSNSRRFIQRARFLAISEFGPQSLVYHEGQAFRVDRALLKEAADRDDGRLTTDSRALCPACGASHPGEHPEQCHVCGTELTKATPVQDLYLIENVGTRAAERITSNDEERKRQGFEILTTFSFDKAGARSALSVEDEQGEVLQIDYAQAATISRINKGLRRRAEKAETGFYMNPKTGVWVGKPKDDGTPAHPEKLTQLIVPLVEDRKNALLLRFSEDWLSDISSKETTLTTLQHALARGIEALFQLEEGEILVEPTPSRENRKALLFYEAAEGGAGALGQLASDPDKISLVAHRALEIMHFDPSTFADAQRDVTKLKDVPNTSCVAGCYRCVLSYFNQPDQENIDRRDNEAQNLLLRLLNSKANLVDERKPVLKPLNPDEEDAKEGSKGAVGLGDLPTADEKPLELEGFVITMIWRQKRIAAVEEQEVNDDLKSALAARGVTLFALEHDSEKRVATIKKLTEALEG